MSTRTPPTPEQEFRTLFDGVNDAIFIHDFQGRFLEVNQVACARLGYERQELLQMVIQDINVPQQQSLVERRIEILARKGHIVFETSHVARDGTTIPTEISSRICEYRGKRVMLSAARDITLRRRLERRLAATQKLESVAVLAGGVAHDFNNILGGILGLASLMKTKLGAEDPLRAYAETIELSAQRAAELTGQLLVFAKQAPRKVVAVDLNQVVRETLNIIAHTLDQVVRVETSLAEDLPTVQGDAAQLSQAVMNLCINAADAMPDGGILRISTTVADLSAGPPHGVPISPAGTYVVLEVADTGQGMSEEVRQHVFEPFYTTKDQGSGTGLGLSVVHGVARHHGGFCEVESQLGHGSTFRVYVPQQPGMEETILDELGVAEGAGELLLVVDDESAMRMVLGEMLEHGGYRVQLAKDGPAALETYRAQGAEIRLVILDLVMPQMSGRECLEELRKLDPAVQALLISGYSSDRATVAGFAPGVAGFLQKPFTTEQLLANVNAALQRG